MSSNEIVKINHLIEDVIDAIDGRLLKEGITEEEKEFLKSLQDILDQIIAPIQSEMSNQSDTS